MDSHRAIFLGEFLKVQRIPQFRGAVVQAGCVVGLGKLLFDNEDLAKAHVPAVLDGDPLQWLVLGIGLGATHKEGADDDGGVDFASLINTACLPPGTYYIEIGGWADTTSVFGFGLQLAQTGTCVVPVPDAYENDDDRSGASDIGLPTSIPSNANGWGRVHKEIQSHTIFPALDIDWMNFDLSRTELVSMQTAITLPTKWNDFLYQPAGLDNDTIIAMWYETEADYGGFCNDNGSGPAFSIYCRADGECPNDPTPPAPGFPICIPVYFFSNVGVR